MLLVIGSILEFILGNTFPCVVFGTIGKSIFFVVFDRLLTLCRCLLVRVRCYDDSFLQCCRFVSSHYVPLETVSNIA